MSCERFEPLVALHVEGDLPGREAAEVEAHLSACGVCQAFADGLRDSQAALKGLGQEELDPAALAAVRRSVSEALDAGRAARPRRLPLAWALTAAAALALIAVLLGWRESSAPTPAVVGRPGVPAAPPSAAAPPSSTERAAASRETAQPRRTARPMKRPPEAPLLAPAAPSVESALLLKLVTNDPDVIIYWLVDQNGGKS
jgi:hypothetical protein